LNFLGIGPGELLLILILALVIFGPRRLPEIGRALGKSIREFRQASDELTEQFREELQAASDELEGASEALKGEKTEGGSESVEGAQELKG
jgi:TatA/E family protein of Tat protein translocase